MPTIIRLPSLRFRITRLLLCLLALAALAPAATAQSVSPTSTLTGDPQSLTDSWASWGRDPVNPRFNLFATRIRRSNVQRLQRVRPRHLPRGQRPAQVLTGRQLNVID